MVDESALPIIMGKTHHKPIDWLWEENYTIVKVLIKMYV